MQSNKVSSTKIFKAANHKISNFAKVSGLNSKVFSVSNTKKIDQINFASKVATSRTTRLETIMLDVFNEKTGNTEKVRAFLDGGSQMTVISFDCAKRCGLELGTPETMMLSTFGQKVSKEHINTTTINL